MPIPKSEAPNPEDFVREQIAAHVGREINDLDDRTIITGSVLALIMEALDDVLQPKIPVITSTLRPGAPYTVRDCVKIVRFRINGQCDLSS